MDSPSHTADMWPRSKTNLLEHVRRAPKVFAMDAGAECEGMLAAIEFQDDAISPCQERTWVLASAWSNS